MPNLIVKGAGYKKKVYIEFTDGSYAYLHALYARDYISEGELSRTKRLMAKYVLRLMYQHSNNINKEVL